MINNNKKAPGLKKPVFFITLIGCSIFLCGISNAWQLQTAETKLLARALSSSSPTKVEKCLDTFIQKRHITGILAIKNHARNMIQRERAGLMRTKSATPALIKKKISAWAAIDQKAKAYFKRTKAEPAGKLDYKTLYHR